MLDHDVSLKEYFPIQYNTNGQESGFLNAEVDRELMLVPAEKDAVGDRFNVHVGAFGGSAVIGRILDDFLVEFFVLSPAGDGVKLFEEIREMGNVEIA